MEETKKMGKAWSREALIKSLARPGSIITAHMNPDDDSISSVLSLHTILKEEGVSIPIIYPAEKRSRWEAIPGYEEIRFVKDLTPFLEENDWVKHIIILDAARPSALTIREQRFLTLLHEKGIETSILDHHETAEMQGSNVHLQEAWRTSTAELIAAHLLTAKSVSTALAEQLLLGILGDTGQLRFITPDQARVFRLVERLVVEGGVSIDAFKARYETFPFETFGRLAALLTDARVMHIPGWPAFIIVKNTLPERDEASMTAKEIMTQYLKQTREAEWGVIFSPKQGGRISLSLRSKAEGIRVVDIVKAMGIGGGHAHAAGGTILTPIMEDAVNLFLSFLQKHSYEDVQRMVEE